MEEEKFIAVVDTERGCGWFERGGRGGGGEMGTYLFLKIMLHC